MFTRDRRASSPTAQDLMDTCAPCGMPEYGLMDACALFHCSVAMGSRVISCNTCSGSRFTIRTTSTSHDDIDVPISAETPPTRSAGEAPRSVLEDLGEDALGCRAHAAEHRLQLSCGVGVDLADHLCSCTGHG